MHAVIISVIQKRVFFFTQNQVNIFSEVVGRGGGGVVWWQCMNGTVFSFVLCWFCEELKDGGGDTWLETAIHPQVESVHFHLVQNMLMAKKKERGIVNCAILLLTFFGDTWQEWIKYIVFFFCFFGKQPGGKLKATDKTAFCIKCREVFTLYLFSYNNPLKKVWKKSASKTHFRNYFFWNWKKLKCDMERNKNGVSLVVWEYIMLLTK